MPARATQRREPPELRDQRRERRRPLGHHDVFLRGAMTRVALVSVAVLGACSVYEDHVRLVPISEAESENINCKKACADPEIDSINFCTVASAVLRPYLVCELLADLSSGPQPFQIGIEPHRG